MTADGFDEFGLPPLRGHNNPPEPTVLERGEQVLVPAADGWTTKGPLKTEDEARLLSEFLVQIRKARDQLKAGEVPERQAHLDALAAIRATVAPLMEPHEKALEEIGRRSVVLLAKLELAIERIGGSKKVTGLLAEWMAREKQRRDEEAEAKRLEAEHAERVARTMEDKASVSGTLDDAIEATRAVEAADEARDAAARKPERVRVKGDLAPRAIGLREYWSAKVVDWKKARQHYRTEDKVKEAYDTAVQAAANRDAVRLKDMSKAPPGVEFLKREQAQ